MLRSFLRLCRHPFLSLRLHRAAITHEDVTPDTDTAFLDSSNLPGFNRSQLEGRLVRSLSVKEVWVMAAVFGVAACAALLQGYRLQVLQYADYAARAENNRFEERPIFANRGVITDRFGRPLAWNEENPAATPDENIFPMRVYDDSPALAHILGYVREPKKDKKGNWWRTSFEAHGGVEGYFNDILSGKNGVALYEIDAARRPVSFVATDPPQDGDPVHLSIDAELTKQLYAAIKDGTTAGFIGGAGIIMDVTTGEIVAMTSFPSFSVAAFAHPDSNTQGNSTEKRESISRYLSDPRYPLLDRVYQGAYLPGSIVKPFVALAALEEGVITPEKGIVSTGKLVIPNPFDPSKPSVFKDWKAHGWVDMRHAIAVSSDVYFYEVGGGFGDQRGMGIAALHTWMTAFGFGQKTGFIFDGEQAGNVPSPAWKARSFKDDTVWNIGNTYHSSIGQYGWLTTPLQAVRAFSALANGGTLFTPTIVRTTHVDADVSDTDQRDSARVEEELHVTPPSHVVFSQKHLPVIYDGMRLSTRIGTAKALDIPGITIAGKTGTAEVGAHKEYMNSWVVGFWPLDKPRFAFVVMLEKSKAGTLRGAAPAMKPFFEHLVVTQSPYIRGEYPDLHIETPIEIFKPTQPSADTASEQVPETYIPEPDVPAYVPN